MAESEDALLRHLFQGYQKWVRPVLNSNDTIKVYFGLKISQLVDVVSPPWRRWKEHAFLTVCGSGTPFPLAFPVSAISILKIACCEKKSAPRGQ